MKCTVCGAEVGMYDKVCTNCGTRVSEMAGTNGKAAFGSNPNAVFEAVPSAPVKKGGKSFLKVFLPTIILILLLMAGTYVLYFIPKEVEFEGAAVKLPYAMKETDDADDASELLSLSGYSLRTYKCYGLNARITKFGSTVDSLDGMTEEEFCEYMGQILEYDEDVNDLKVDGNVLTFNTKNDSDQDVFVYVAIEYGDENVYMLEYQCLTKRKGIYESYFEKWHKASTF